jgi:hypothetical protein
VCLLAADELVLHVLERQLQEVGINRRVRPALAAAAETEHQVKRGLLLDVVVGERAVILQLLPCKDQALLLCGNTYGYRSGNY